MTNILVMVEIILTTSLFVRVQLLEIFGEGQRDYIALSE